MDLFVIRKVAMDLDGVLDLTWITAEALVVGVAIVAAIVSPS